MGDQAGAAEYPALKRWQAGVATRRQAVRSAAITSGARTDPDGTPYPPRELYTGELLPRLQSAQQKQGERRDACLAQAAAIEARASAEGRRVTDEESARAAKLRTTAEVAGSLYRDLGKDIETLTGPGASNQAINEVIARRGTAPAVARTTKDLTGLELLEAEGQEGGRVSSGWGVSGNRLTRSGATVGSEVSEKKGGPVSRTSESSDTASVGLDSDRNLTVAWGTGDKTRTVDPYASVERGTTKTNTLSLLGDRVGYTHETVERTDLDLGAPMVRTTSVEKTTYAADSTGVSRSHTDSLRQGDRLDSVKTDVGFKRGDGALTFGGSLTRRAGTVKDEPGGTEKERGEGTLTKGSTATAGGKAGLYNDKELGTGAGADGAGEYGYTRKGLDLGVKAGGGGRWYVNVKKVEGSSTEVLVITSIVLSASLSLSAGTSGTLNDGSPGWGDAASKDKLGVTLTGSAARSERATYANKLGVDQAKEYLEIMARNGEGGSLPEHRLLQVGFNQGWDAARKAWNSRTPEQLAAAAPELGKDEYQETSKDTSLGGNLAGKLSAGDFELGGSLGHAHQQQVTARVTGTDDTSVTVRMTVNRIDSDSYGASMKLAAVGGSYDLSKSASEGSVYEFVVPRTDRAIIADLLAAKTLDDLVAMRGRYSALLKGYSDLKGKSDTEKFGLSLGPVKATLAGTGSYTEKIDRDATGKEKGATFTGSSDTGGSIGFGSVALGSTEQRTFEGTVERGAGASGEDRLTGKSEHGSTTFSAGKTWDAVKGAASDPLKLVTDGPGSLVKNEKTTDRAMFYGSEDYDNIVWLSHDEKAWMDRVSSPSRRPEWRRTMRAVRAASHWEEGKDGHSGRWAYDPNKVQQALAAWNAAADPTRLGAVDSLVRGKSGDGGVLASFPGELASLEPEYRALVVQDAVRDSKALKAAEDVFVRQPDDHPDFAAVNTAYVAAITDLAGILARLEALNTGLKDQAAKFAVPGMHGEMMARLSARLNSARQELSAARERAANAARGVTGAVHGAADPEGAAAEVTAPSPPAQDGIVAADPAAGEAEAKGNVDQMWRHNAALWNLLDRAHYSFAKSVYNAAESNQALRDANRALADWDRLRKRNAALVRAYQLGDWLHGPDPAPLHTRYGEVYRETH